MSRIERTFKIWMHVGLSILVVAVFISLYAPGYVIKRYELFESQTQLKNGSTLKVKCESEKTKIKFAFSKKEIGFGKYPQFSQYYLQIVQKDGKNVAVFAPDDLSNVGFAGRVIAREDHESIHSIMNNYETEHPGFRFENSVIVCGQTSPMKTVEIISDVLYAISFILGFIILKKVRKHFLL
jgi:S-adenosylmethionine/arginine decarboxylase-like enzyme